MKCNDTSSAAGGPGVEDDGYPRGLEPRELQGSVAVLQSMAQALQAVARVVEEVPGAKGRKAVLLHIKQKEEENVTYIDLRVVGECWGV